MKTTIVLVGTVIGFIALGLITNYIGESYTGQEIKSKTTLVLGILSIGLPIGAFALMIWDVLFGPYDGPPYL